MHIIIFTELFITVKFLFNNNFSLSQVQHHLPEQALAKGIVDVASV